MAGCSGAGLPSFDWKLETMDDASGRQDDFSTTAYVESENIHRWYWISDKRDVMMICDRPVGAWDPLKQESYLHIRSFGVIGERILVSRLLEWFKENAGSIYGISLGWRGYI